MDTDQAPDTKPDARRLTGQDRTERQKARERKARLRRDGYPPDSPEVVAADLRLREMRLQAAIEAEIAKAPPLSEETLASLRALLVPRPDTHPTQ